MATFELTITAAGLALLAKAQLGAAIEFTRLAIGDGALGELNPTELEDLVSRLMWVTISSIRRDGTDVSVAGVFNNAEAAEAFYYREVGLYAEDPDDGEILYMYGNAGETADEIPAAGTQVIERIINITTVLSTEITLTVELDSGAYVLASECHNVLWTGSWTTGDIEVPNFDKYKLFAFEFLDEQQALAYANNGTIFGGTSYIFLTFSIEQTLRVTYSGTTLTLISAKRMLHNESGSHSVITSPATITRIIGVI